MGNGMSKVIENQRQKLELEYEARKRGHELDAEKAKNYYELELRKADMNHQHKIAELIAQMKQTKFQSGKDLCRSYMETINIIIQQNDTAIEKINPLLGQLQNDKLPESLKDSIVKTAKKILDGYMDTRDLLEFARKEVERLDLKQDEEFSRLLEYAVDQNVISNENKIYLLE